MNTTSSATRPANGGAPARRAVVRWAWRLFRREWRQQLLILALITIAVTATIVGLGRSHQQPAPFELRLWHRTGLGLFCELQRPHRPSLIANLRHRFGPVEVIENEAESIPGSINTFALRAEDPHGAFSGPMLSLVSGRYPSKDDEVAVTSGVASAFHLSVGADLAPFRRHTTCRRHRREPAEPFGQLRPRASRTAQSIPARSRPCSTCPVLPSAHLPRASQVQTPASVAQSNPINPETISLVALVLGMLLIALVSVGGFTVLAQRRLRSIGMLESTGATDRHVRLVVSANGTLVGVLGALLGLVLGLVVWLVYRPSLEQSSHHLIGAFALPWVVIAAAMVLATLAAYFAASRPARAITKVPIVQALSGRPAPPRQIRRSAIPGIVLLVLAFLLLGYSGGTNHGNGSGGAPELLLGLVLLVPGLILLAPFFLSLTARLGRRAPLAARLALRDLARYRARSGSALSAISVGVLVAVIVMLAAASCYGNVLDYAGPNLAANELWLHASQPPQGQPTFQRNANGQLVPVKNHPVETATPAQLGASAAWIAKALGAQLIPLETTNAAIVTTGNDGGRSWNGPIYVATPQLLRAFGIKSSEIDPNVDILSSRPGLSGVSGLGLDWASGQHLRTVPAGCVLKPVIQEMGALPSGTSAPNTVITEHAVREFHLQASTQDWLVQGTQAFTASEISGAEQTASTTQLAVEAKNDQPSSTAVIGWATIFGIVIALGVLGMSVGLVRSETASDLRTLAATGASSLTRRTLTAVTAGALGFLGALLGVVGGYVGMIGWLRSNSLNGGISALGGNIPVADLLLILLGMPAFAAVIGWLFAGREPPSMAHQAIE